MSAPRSRAAVAHAVIMVSHRAALTAHRALRNNVLSEPFNRFPSACAAELACIAMTRHPDTLKTHPPLPVVACVRCLAS